MKKNIQKSTVEDQQREFTRIEVIERGTFIAKEIDRQIEAFHRRREEYKRKSILAKLLIAILAACSTVLIGLQGVADWLRVWLQNAALVFTAGVTLATSLEAFFNHRSLYVRYTATTIQLYMLKSDFQYLVASRGGDFNNVKSEELDRIYEKLVAILDQTSAEWLAARKEQMQAGCCN